LNKIKNVTGIVQARMGSTRFPGKMLMNLGQYPVIEWVLRRSKQSDSLDKVILATSDLSIDDELDKIANKLKIDVYRGSEVDVLGRFYGAADRYETDTIVRICADNPFIDPYEIKRLINFYNNNNCDYACNHQDRLGSGYVDGFGAEIFSKNILIDINSRAKEEKYREHVTLFLWDNMDKYILKSVPSPKVLNYPNLRFDVDTVADLTYLNNLLGNNLNEIKPEKLNIHDILSQLI